MENSQVTIKTRDSLATRFILIAATLVIILQLVFAIFQIYGNYQRNLDGLVNDANNTALLLSTVTTEAMLTSDFLFLETLMQQTNNAPDVIYSFISDTTGNPTTRFVDRSEPIILDIIDSGEASTLLAIFDMAAQEPNVHIVTLPIELEGEAIGEVHLAYSLASIQSELVRSIVSTSLASILMVLGLTLGIFLVFEQTVRRPLQYLGELAQDLASGNLKRRAEIQRQNEIGQLGNSFNNMAAQLEALIDGLEQRVAARTRDLEIAADVSSQVSRVLDMKELLPYLVNTTREGFKLAHVSIFLHQSETGILNLAASSGNIGQMMMEEGKQFHLNDKGLVPLTARTSEHQIINNVQVSKDYSVNPLLPDTRSETALPMYVGTRLIGVLDLQSNEVDHFSDEQLAVLTSLADQIAIAVQNAELFEEARIAREAAERSDQVKSSFLASMSHELRTPLNGIMNFTGVVADGMLGPVNEKQEKFLKDAVNNAEHLLSLINDVLDISKIESGELKLFVEDNIDIAALYREVARTGETLVDEKPVELILELADDLPSITGDSRRIRQILLNIVSNACKFTREGSVTIGIRQENQDILLWVKDTGPGIAPEDYEAVFETFLQTETGLRSGGGTGLGMPISRKLAEAHGGRLWIESEPGKGATFFVTLPIQSEELKMQIIA